MLRLKCESQIHETRTQSLKTRDSYEIRVLNIKAIFAFIKSKCMSYETRVDFQKLQRSLDRALLSTKKWRTHFSPEMGAAWGSSAGGGCSSSLPGLALDEVGCLPLEIIKMVSIWKRFKKTRKFYGFLRKLRKL